MRASGINGLVRATLVVCLVAATWLGGSSGLVWAAEEAELQDQRFSMGVGFAHVRFDTNFKFTEKDTGRDLFVDAEGTLGLPERENVPLVFGRYRFSKKHALAFSAFRIRRQSTLFAEDLNLGNFTITGEATLSDNTRFYYLNYTYTFLQDDRMRIFGAFGLYGLDLRYALDLFGEIDYRGVPLASETYSRDASVFAPLPMFGLDAVFALSPRWSLSTKITLVGGSYQDVSAAILDTSIRSRYMFSKHVGLLLAIKYFNAEVNIDDSDLKTEVAYGFDGLSVGLALGF